MHAYVLVKHVAAASAITAVDRLESTCRRHASCVLCACSVPLDGDRRSCNVGAAHAVDGRGQCCHKAPVAVAAKGLGCAVEDVARGAAHHQATCTSHTAQHSYGQHSRAQKRVVSPSRECVV